ncbi:sensor histidine kinase [Pseudoxanthomonas dokdonensis]|uniref:sensor histidine kinase n=1 Tax=Pseudoxanthomonas dokdonensis TaxID=344882 RepID=UPI001FDEB9F1|nr:HWE histidine kinase domain-containing protein [Pseudoxanthomonas dokdonensis]
MNTKVEPALAAERLYDAILQATPDLVYVFDLDHRFLYANQALLSMWGRSWDEAIGKTCLELGYEPWHAAMHDAEIEQVKATRKPVRGEVPFRHHTLGMRTYDYIFTPVFGADGDVAAVAGSTRDVTERTQHEAHMRLLLNELNHRVKNTLTVVQSISQQTMRNSTSMDEAQDKIESRILALSKAHDILTRQNWQGAEISEIVRATTAHCQVCEHARFDMQGPEILLDPRRAVALAMALHELCTNALKYGALSSTNGRVQVQWRIADEPSMLYLEWKESGGPAVKVPTRRGFGSRLIEKGLGYEAGGEARLVFEPDGLACFISMPLATTATGDAP